MVMVDSTAQPLARGGTRASVSQAQIEAEAAAIRALLAANKIANADRSLFPWRRTDIVAPPENMAPFEARAAKLADPASGLESVYQTLASERWRKQQEDLERRLAGMGRGDLVLFDSILSSVESFWMGEGHDLAAITLRRALGYELLKSLDLRDEALRRSLLVVLSMNHCAKGGQAIGDLNTCGTGCCLSTESTAQQLQMVYAEGGFGADVKVVVIAFNGTPVCERDAESSCGCAVPKRGEQTAAMRRFMEFQQALVDAFLGPDVRTAVMSAYAGHADPATTGLAMAVPTGSVTLSETGAGAVEVTVGLWHPAGLQRKVAVAMGAGGDEQREVDRALAKQRVVDHLAALRRWAAALAVLRDRRLKGSATAPCPWLLDAVAVAVPPTEVTSQELRALWINPAEASGEGPVAPVRSSLGPRGSGARCRCAVRLLRWNGHANVLRGESERTSGPRGRAHGEQQEDCGCAR